MRPHIVAERPRTIGRRVPKPILVASIVAVAVLIIGGTTAYLLTRNGGSAPVGGAPPSSAHARTVNTPVRQTETWITANVAADTPVCGDQAVAAQLGKAGYTAASTCRPDGSFGENRFVVSTPDIRAAIAVSLAAAVRQRASLPMAVFGTGAERVTVRMVVPGAQTALAARLAHDLHDRALAAAALLHNRKLTAAAAGITRNGLMIRVLSTPRPKTCRSSSSAMQVPMTTDKITGQTVNRTVLTRAVRKMWSLKIVR
jgi:hypothetical protein